MTPIMAIVRYCFLDWSGDLGFKFGRGSSPYLVFALVYCADEEPIRKAFGAIKERLGLPRVASFHYVSTRQRARRIYFETIGDEAVAFEAIVLVVNKIKLSAEQRRTRQATLYAAFILNLFTLIEEPVDAARFWIEGDPRDPEIAIRTRVSLSQANRRLKQVAYAARRIWMACNWRI